MLIYWHELLHLKPTREGFDTSMLVPLTPWTDEVIAAYQASIQQEEAPAE